MGPHRPAPSWGATLFPTPSAFAFVATHYYLRLPCVSRSHSLHFAYILLIHNYYSLRVLCRACCTHWQCVFPMFTLTLCLTWLTLRHSRFPISLAFVVCVCHALVQCLVCLLYYYVLYIVFYVCQSLVYCCSYILYPIYYIVINTIKYYILYKHCISY